MESVQHFKVNMKSLLFFKKKKMQYLLYTSKYVKRIDLWISGTVEHGTLFSLQEQTSVTLNLLLTEFPFIPPSGQGNGCTSMFQPDQLF